MVGVVLAFRGGGRRQGQGGCQDRGTIQDVCSDGHRPPPPQLIRFLQLTCRPSVSRHRSAAEVSISLSSLANRSSILQESSVLASPSLLVFDSGGGTRSAIGDFDHLMGTQREAVICDFKPTQPFRSVTCDEDFLAIFYEGPPFKYKHSIRTRRT